MGLLRLLGSGVAKGATGIYSVVKENRKKNEVNEDEFWNTPEGYQVRKEREIARIRIEEEEARARARSYERKEIAETSRMIAEEEEMRQERQMNRLKDL